MWEPGRIMHGRGLAALSVRCGGVHRARLRPHRAAGYFVASVLDLFQSGGATVAVLDTTVNHMPEVFEYGFQPDVVGHDDDAPHEYLLAGCTCLAGDLFGTYRFPEPLGVGDKVVFSNAGSYTLVKAHTFNRRGPAVGVCLYDRRRVGLAKQPVLRRIRRPLGSVARGNRTQ